MMILLLHNPHCRKFIRKLLIVSFNSLFDVISALKKFFKSLKL